MSFKRFMFAVLLSLAAVAAAHRVAHAEPRQIVGFGDSLMAGYGLGAGEGFTDRLQKALVERGHDVVIHNAGVSGDTTSGGLSRLDWSVPEGTDIVVLELGANDMLRGVTPDITRRNLDAMITRLKERGITVILAGMRAAPNLGADFAAAFDPIFPDLARKHGVSLYPFFLDGVVANRTLLLDDGMHPNAQGINRMVEGFLPVIEQALKQASG